MARWRQRVAEWLSQAGLAGREEADRAADLYLCTGANTVSAYTDADDSIRILERDGRVRELSATAEVTDIGRLAVPVVRHYVCAPKHIQIDPAGGV
jgi:uncharacterized protein